MCLVVLLAICVLCVVYLYCYFFFCVFCFFFFVFFCFFFQAEDGIRDLVRSRGLGDVYKRQLQVSPLRVHRCATNSASFTLSILFVSEGVKLAVEVKDQILKCQIRSAVIRQSSKLDP